MTMDFITPYCLFN